MSSPNQDRLNDITYVRKEHKIMAGVLAGTNIGRQQCHIGSATESSYSHFYKGFKMLIIAQVAPIIYE